MRKITKTVTVGGVQVGGGHRITVQSMLNASHMDYDALKAQTMALQTAGADIIRMAVPDEEAVCALHKLKSKSELRMPIVADIHYDYRLAVESVAAGADAIRINPGNIGGEDKVKAVVNACIAEKVPIRIGVNGGSLEKHLLAKYGHPCAEALAKSALYHASLLERLDFDQIVLSVKSSDVSEMIAANRILSEQCDYPLHIGVTEAGTIRMGTLKSAIGIGALLADGIGDTIRVSLTADPVKEIEAGFDILKAAGIRKSGAEIISCPTCGRSKVDVISLAEQVERRFAGLGESIKIAVMGCSVNGPGEAREADVGVACGVGEGLIFARGEILRKVPEAQILDALAEEVEQIIGN